MRKSRNLWLALLLAAWALFWFGICLVEPGYTQTLQTYATTGVNFTFPTLSAVATSSSIAVNNVIPTKHGMQVNTTGAPAACIYNLEGSLDGVNWTSIINAQACTTSGTLTWETTGAKPVLFVRFNLTALSGGATASAFYVGSK